jgi:hypothetical protein
VATPSHGVGEVQRRVRGDPAERVSFREHGHGDSSPHVVPLLRRDMRLGLGQSRIAPLARFNAVEA